MSRQIIAIDIRNDLIAAVVLETGLKSNTVIACHHVPYSGDPVGQEGLGEAIAELLADLPIDNASLVLGLPAHISIYRRLAIPFKDNNKISQVLPFELEPTLPLPVENLVIGFQKELVLDQAQVMATAVERRLLEGYMDLFNDHGLKPQLVVPGGFPAVLSLTANDAEFPEHALVVDVDKTRVTLFAMAAGQICLVRSLPAVIDSETETEQLALKIRQTITAFADAQAVDFSPSAVFLHGPGLKDPAALKRLTSALDWPTQAMELHNRINSKIEMGAHLTYNSWLYDNALASACLEAEGIDCPNYHRSSSTIRNFWASYRPYIRTPAIILAVITILGLGGILYDSHQLQKRLNGIKNKQEQVFKSTFPGASLTKAEMLSQMQSKFKAAQKNVAAPIQSGNRMPSIDALMEISRLLPNSISVVMNRMVVSEDTITLSGETNGFNTVDDIKSRIEKSAYFKKVTIASANMDKSGTTVRFKLKIEL